MTAVALRVFAFAFVLSVAGAGQASADCTSSGGTQTANLTPLIVNGVMTSVTQSYTVQAGCTGDFYVAVTATRASVSAPGGSGYDAVVRYSVHATVGGIEASVVATDPGTVKQVSATTTPGVSGTVPVAVSVTPVSGSPMVAGAYSGQIVVSVCELAAEC